MANIVIVSTSTHIDVEFNIYSSDIGYTKASFAKDDMQIVAREYSRDVIKIDMNTRDFAVWYCSYDSQPNSYIIDSIDGVAPTSCDDLYDKLKDLM